MNWEIGKKGKLSRELFVFGGEQSRETLQLAAGPLTMLFEPDTVFLRRITLGKVEAIRGIYAAVRDRNWGTVPARISNVDAQIANDACALTFKVECRQGEVHFRWHGGITGAADGSVKFSFEGEALSSFLRNRIGLCVLHPLAGCVGQPCEVEHIDGNRERGNFPQFISPHQPFREIRALRHEVTEGVSIEVRFEGDVFEMEDQRNWTDASFKTYCTPLDLPFPAAIEKGTHIRQTVTLRMLRHDRQEAVHSPKKGVRKSRPALAITEIAVPGEPRLPLPPIGLGLASQEQSLSPGEVQRLQLLRLSHLRADLTPGQPDWRRTLLRATREAAELDCTLQLALFLTDQAEAELTVLAHELEATRPPVSLFLVFHVGEEATREHWVRLAQSVLTSAGSDIPIAAGANGNFAELNRHRPATDSIAMPCFSLNPQVHTFDNLSLVENLAAQAHAVATTRQFSERPVVISPATLKPRLNVVATAKDWSPAADELPPSVDPRQLSLFGAAWTLGSIAALSATGQVHSLTYYETTGWRGVMETEAGSPMPEKFPSRPGQVFPIYEVLASLAGFARFAPLTVSAHSPIAGLVLFDGHRCRVMLANLTGTRHTVILRCPKPIAGGLILDEANVPPAVCKPEQFRARVHGATGDAPGRVELTMRRHAFVVLDLA